jgi:hypothetical protein
MRVQDWYIRTLEKRATEEAGLDYSVDNQVVANSDVTSNEGEQRAYLNSMFNNAQDVGKNDTKLLKAEFPEAKNTEGTMAGNPLVKVGMQQVFFEGLRKTDLLKMASLDYIKMAFASFNDELAKIAALEWLDDAVRAATKGLKPRGTAPLRSVPLGSQPISLKDLRPAKFPEGSVVKAMPKMASFFTQTAKAGKRFMEGTLGKAQRASKVVPPPIPGKASLPSMRGFRSLVGGGHGLPGNPQVVFPG